MGDSFHFYQTSGKIKLSDKLFPLPRQYQEEVDLGFPGSLVCALLLLLLLGGIQAVALPRTTILLLLFLTAFIWIAVILMLLLAVRYEIIIYIRNY